MGCLKRSPELVALSAFKETLRKGNNKRKNYSCMRWHLHQRFTMLVEISTVYIEATACTSFRRWEKFLCLQIVIIWSCLNAVSNDRSFARHSRENGNLIRNLFLI